MATPELFDRFKRATLVDQPSESMRSFLDAAPSGVGEAVVNLIETINSAPSLDYATKALLRMCANMTMNYDHGVRSWALVAMKEGMSRTQLIEAMYTLIPQLGLAPIVRMLPVVLSVPEPKDAPMTGNVPGTNP